MKASFSRRLCLKTSRANRRCRLRLTASKAKAMTATMLRGVRTCPRLLGCSGVGCVSRTALSMAHPDIARITAKLRIEERELEAGGLN